MGTPCAQWARALCSAPPPASSGPFGDPGDAYYNGIVIARCDGCLVNHLISDNLDWVEPGFGTLEDWARRQADQKVHKYTDEDGVEATWISRADALPADTDA